MSQIPVPTPARTPAMSTGSESKDPARAANAIADTGRNGGNVPQRPYRCTNPDEGYEDDGRQASEVLSTGNADDLDENRRPPYMITVWLPGDEPARLPLPPLARFRNR